MSLSIIIFRYLFMRNSFLSTFELFSSIWDDVYKEEGVGMILKKALLVIDYTVDFVALDGALTCGEPGIELEEYITSLTETFLNEGHFVVFPVDVHDLDDSVSSGNKTVPTT